MLDDIDAAIVAAPHHLHYPIGMALMEAGRHVLMEKWPIPKPSALIQASEAAGVTFMVAYCMRFHPVVNEMERLIKSKVYGEGRQVQRTFEIRKRPAPADRRPPQHA